MADTVVGDLVARLRADTSDFTSGLQSAERDTKSFADKMESAGKSMMSFGAKMSVGVSLPLVALGKVAFDAASDLNESINKVEVVFAQNSKAILKWSEDAATAFGMSRQEALEAAGTFGNLFRSMNIALPTATKMSKSLVELAADLASFNNSDPSEVLMALRSGLVGEVEPLRRFGISLSAARVETKAMEMGLADANGELSEAAKAQARYAIILEDSTLAQGDFARTADSAANRQRILQAQFKDTAAQLGQALIPIMQMLMSVVTELFEAFNSLSPSMQKAVVILGLLLAAVGPVSTAIGALIAGALNPAVLAVGAFATAFLATTYILEQVFGKTKDITQGLQDLEEQAASLAKVNDEHLAQSFAQLILKYGELHPLAAGMTVTLGAFEEVVDQNVGTAIRLAEQYRQQPALYNAMQAAIARANDEQARFNIDTQNAANAVADAEGRIRAQTGALDAQAIAYIRASEAARSYSAAQTLGAGFGYVDPSMQFADGGIVPGPVGMPQMAMVHGGEMILNPQQQAAMGGDTIINVYGVEGNPAEIAFEVARVNRTANFLAGR